MPCHNAGLQRAVKTHIKRIVYMLETCLRRDMWSATCQETINSCTSDSSKLSLLAARLQSSGPPLRIALDHVPVPSRRVALASLFTADWRLAVHAHNHFAKSLLPSSVCHAAAVQDAVPRRPAGNWHRTPQQRHSTKREVGCCPPTSAQVQNREESSDQH